MTAMGERLQGTVALVHLRDGMRETIRARFRDIERLTSEDIADAIECIVTRPQRVAVNEILIRPTEQHW
jgi:NADP-dependent 3-hydroxy acid dehydrogenase YdfG